VTWRSLDSELVARAHRVLAAASVVSEATTSSPDQAKVRSAPGSTPPAGDGDSLFHRFVRVLAAAGTDEDKLRDAIHRAETDLAAYRRARQTRPPETADQRDARIVRDYEGLLPVEAARLEQVSAENIRRVRFAAGRDTGTGEKRQYGWKTVNERRVLAMQFASVGWPARRIADELGVSHTQIQRDLRTDQTGDTAA
jgi:hypothetical protein